MPQKRRKINAQKRKDKDFPQVLNVRKRNQNRKQTLKKRISVQRDRGVCETVVYSRFQGDAEVERGNPNDNENMRQSPTIQKKRN